MSATTRIRVPLLDLTPSHAPLAEAILADVAELIESDACIAPGSEPVWHLYVLRTARPADLGAVLRARGIGTGRHYPQPVHLTAAYASLGHRKGAFPVAEALATEALSLPIFPGISEEQLAAVVAAAVEYFDGA